MLNYLNFPLRRATLIMDLENTELQLKASAFEINKRRVANCTNDELKCEAENQFTTMSVRMTRIAIFQRTG